MSLTTISPVCFILCVYTMCPLISFANQMVIFGLGCRLLRSLAGFTSPSVVGRIFHLRLISGYRDSLCVEKLRQFLYVILNAARVASSVITLEDSLKENINENVLTFT